MRKKTVWRPRPAAEIRSPDGQCLPVHEKRFHDLVWKCLIWEEIAKSRLKEMVNEISFSKFLEQVHGENWRLHKSAVDVNLTE